MPARVASLAEVDNAAIEIRRLPRLDNGLAGAMDGPGISIRRFGRARCGGFGDILQRDDLHGNLSLIAEFPAVHGARPCLGHRSYMRISSVLRRHASCQFGPKVLLMKPAAGDRLRPRDSTSQVVRQSVRLRKQIRGHNRHLWKAPSPGVCGRSGFGIANRQPNDVDGSIAAKASGGRSVSIAMLRDRNAPFRYPVAPGRRAVPACWRSHDAGTTGYAIWHIVW